MNKIMFYYIFIFVLFLSISKKVIAGSNHFADTALINKLHSECKSIIYTDPLSANIKIDSIIKLSNEIHYKLGLYKAYNSRGIVGFMLNDHKYAISSYLKSLQYVDTNKKSQEIRLYSNLYLSYSLSNNSDSALYYLLLENKLAKQYKIEYWYAQSVLDLGNYYLNNSEYANAASYLLIVDEICETSKDTIYILKAYSSLALFYKTIDDFDKSYLYFSKSIEIDKRLLTIDLLSVNYSNMGELFLRLKSNYDTAIYYYKKSVEVANPYNKNQTILQSNINIGNVFLEKDDVDSSFYYYSKAYNDTLLSYFPHYKAAILVNIGYYHYKKVDYNKAVEFLLEGLSLSNELDLLTFKSLALKHLWRLEKDNDNYKQALYYHEEYNDVIDLLQSEEAINKLAIINYDKYLVDKKYKNELLIGENFKQQHQLFVYRVIIGFVILIVITLLVFVYLLSKKRKVIKELNSGLTKNYAALSNVNDLLRNQESELLVMLKNKDRFVSIIGHDLKNPFSGLLGLLEIMDSDWDEMDDKEKKESIGLLYQSSIQTYQLLEDLLEWGKTQQGLIKAKFENVDLSELVDKVIINYKIQLLRKKIEVENEIPKGTKVFTDSKLSSQIFHNFLGNAIKYSHNDARIFIKFIITNNTYNICVVDQGIGIPGDKIATLFEFDSNFNRPGTNNEKSTGMGLILCKEYSDLIGSKIEVNSVVDKGSSFCLLIDKISIS